MTKTLNDKKVVITGASSGIGQRIAWHIAASGAIPILVARSKSRLEEVSQNIEQRFNLKTDYYTCDIGNKEQWQETMSRIVKDHNQIHILINNAGVGLFQHVSDMELAELERMFSVNVHALIQASHFFLTHMLKNGEGHIVNISSQAGKMATPKAAGYAATKHAVLGFTHGLRLEVEKQGIFVTAVNLGPVKTNFLNIADPSGKYEKSIERFLLDPDDVAKKIVNRLYRNTREINMPFWMEAGSRFYRLFPGLFEKLFKKQFAKK